MLRCQATLGQSMTVITERGLRVIPYHMSPEYLAITDLRDYIDGDGVKRECLVNLHNPADIIMIAGTEKFIRITPLDGVHNMKISIPFERLII